MDRYLFFFVGFSLLLAHEMDAIRLREWKIFPLLSALPDEQAYTVFTALHIPLYSFLLWGLSTGGEGLNQWVVSGLDLFCIMHVALHMVFRNHPHNHFHSWFSWTLILGAGVAGAIDLLLHV